MRIARGERPLRESSRMTVGEKNLAKDDILESVQCMFFFIDTAKHSQQVWQKTSETGDALAAAMTAMVMVSKRPNS